MFHQNMQITVKMDVTMQLLNIGAHHPSGTVILTIEPDSNDGLYYKAFQGNIRDPDLSAAAIGTGSGIVLNVEMSIESGRTMRNRSS